MVQCASPDLPFRSLYSYDLRFILPSQSLPESEVLNQTGKASESMHWFHFYNQRLFIFIQSIVINAVIPELRPAVSYWAQKIKIGLSE